MTSATRICPRCSYERSASLTDCPRCELFQRRAILHRLVNQIPASEYRLAQRFLQFLRATGAPGPIQLEDTVTLEEQLANLEVDRELVRGEAAYQHFHEFSPTGRTEQPRREARVNPPA